MSPTEIVRELPAVEGTPDISIDFSPHKEEYQYNVGGSTVKPSPTAYYAHINETVTLTATVTFANTEKQWAIAYEWDLGDGTLAYNNPATHKYALPNEHLQVSLTVTDNFGQEWRARKAMYLK
jgi:PKD repeat protein